MEQIHVVVDAPEYCLSPFYDIWWLCLEKGEWASWVQAIGALIAIGFTIRQSVLASREAEKNREEKKEAAHAMIANLETRCGQTVYDLVWQLNTSFETTRMLQGDLRQATLLEIQDSTKAIQLQHLPDADSVARVFKILKTVDEVRKLYMRAGASLKDKTDQLSAAEWTSLKQQLRPYINAAMQIPGVQI